MLGVSSIGAFAYRPQLRVPDSDAGRENNDAVAGPDARTEAQGKTDREGAEAARSPGQDELSEDEQREVQDLKSRDREVRVHEQAHIAASGRLTTSGPFYQYETGPDGRRYVVDGEVKIRAPRSDDPEETIRIQEQLIRASLAPAEPSGQDRRVAAGARQKIARAQAELAEGERGERGQSDNGALGLPEAKARPTASEGVSTESLESSFSRRAIERYTSVAYGA